MYPWVTHTHVHLGGECPHRCTYCYVNSRRFGRPPKYQGPLRLIESEFSVNYGTGKTIFIENCNDLFAVEVPNAFINRIISHCRSYPFNTYIFQSKNPARFSGWNFPPSYIIGTTIESNRWYEASGNAPSPIDRMLAIERLPGKKFVTIEPVMDFDVDCLASWIHRIRPEFISLGADSKNHNLHEPTVEKIIQFTEKMKEYGIELREKHNLSRLKGFPFGKLLTETESSGA